LSPRSTGSPPTARSRWCPSRRQRTDDVARERRCWTVPSQAACFFEQLIRDNLGLRRPDKVSLVFGRQGRTRGRRPTPSRFRARVLTADVSPSIHVDYKHSKIKQCHRLGRTIRTETTINDTRDFGIGKRLGNLPAPRRPL
jgi:hypothetical protein